MNTPDRAFYSGPTLKTAWELLGKILVHESPEGLCAGMITETEAYIGPEDDGAHSYGGKRTPRTEIQYGPGGFSYVFPIYGMYYCFNAVTAPEGRPEVVLIRALELVEGIELMKKRRRTENVKNLCSGPGKLCMALGIGREQYGMDLCTGPLRIENYRSFDESEILLSPRINIDYAEKCRDYPWRFYVKNNPCVSKVPGRFAPVGTLEEMKNHIIKNAET